MMQFMTATVLLLWTGAADSQHVQVRLVVYMIISLIFCNRVFLNIKFFH